MSNPPPSKYSQLRHSGLGSISVSKNSAGRFIGRTPFLSVTRSHRVVALALHICKLCTKAVYFGAEVINETMRLIHPVSRLWPMTTNGIAIVLSSQSGHSSLAQCVCRSSDAQVFDGFHNQPPSPRLVFV